MYPRRRCCPYHQRELLTTRGEDTKLTLLQPIGAMGLTTGILDSEAAADALELIINSHAPLKLLSLYGDERRRIFQFFVNPLATANILRLKQPTENALDDWLLRALNHPTPEFLRKSGEGFFTEWRSDIRKLATNRGFINSLAKPVHVA